MHLRDADLGDREQRQGAVDHQQKLLTAFINLLSASDRFQTLPNSWQDSVWSWFDTNQLMRLRNNSLYLRFSKDGKLSTPEVTITDRQAALLVYLAGFAGVELGEYVNLDPAWVESLRRDVEKFRAKYLEG